MVSKDGADKESLGADLRRLGVRPGDTVLAHTSLSSLGWVCGGAVAVVQALLDVLGENGTLVVPAQTANNRDPSLWSDPAVDEADWPAIRANLPAFDPAITPSHRMGVIAEQVRTWPGARRSDHPQTSFAAVGARAEELMADHRLTSPLGEHSPLARLEEADARILLLGVGMAVCTSFHLAEYRLPDPPRRMNYCAVQKRAPAASGLNTPESS
ncbi:aminoglycoside N(3)-acetyltransferase [Luedemannella flava]